MRRLLIGLIVLAGGASALPAASYAGVPPTIISAHCVEASPTTAPSVSWTITFSRAVTGVEPADVTLARSGDVGVDPPTVGSTDGGLTQTVTVPTGTGTGSGSGSVALSGLTDANLSIVAVDDATPADLTWHGVDNAPCYTIDRTGPIPTVLHTAQGAATDRTPVEFLLDIDETPVGLSAADVVVGGTAGATTASMDADTADPRDRTVRVSGMTQSGTVTISLTAGVFTDALGNTSAASSGDGSSVDYTFTAPAPELPPPPPAEPTPVAVASPAPLPPAGDRVPAVVKLPAAALRLDAKRRVPLVITCTDAGAVCSLRVRLTVGSGSASQSVCVGRATARRTGAVAVRLNCSPAGLQRITRAGARGLATTLVVTAFDGAGNRAAARRVTRVVARR